MKTAFICFFPVFPTNMGSAEVIRSLFLCWPGQKKLFQISHLNYNNSNNNLFSVKIIKEKPILKILCIPFLIYKILKYLGKTKKRLLVIEGPSWIGYSFITLILTKILSPSTKIIYHSHSIEYEVRKMFSSNFMAVFSKKLENFVFNNSDLSTSVSKIETNKIKKLYGVKCISLKNGISEKVLNFRKKKVGFDYIIYTGSYKYLPNKSAIDYLVDILMPKIIKKYPKLKLVLTGGGYEKKKNFVVNFGIISKPKLLNLIYNSKLMVLPIDKGTGTRIKIIEAMQVGAKILTTKKGIEGISFKKKKFPIVLKKEFFYKSIIKNLKKNSRNKKLIQINKNYTMEKIVSNFFRNKHVENIFKTN
tara:strand:+ start:1203 stop:2285 length:1083 start_codon:yes stop_codon:yes gene_type:complete